MKPKEIENRTAIEREELETATRLLMQNLQLRPFLWWLLEQCGIYRQNMSANSAMYLMEGQRSIGLQVIALMDEVDPTAYPAMLLDAAKTELARRVNANDGSKHVGEKLD